MPTEYLWKGPDVENRLARESSPYLLQHAGNPVDWYPWGGEALKRARDEDKPILLSIGYSACHWCHVMERESFEDASTAALMNEHFVNIKVDREERPDLDSIYMKAVQALIGRGGWPLTAFLTPAGEVFFGGTYFPPEPRHGMPAFRQILSMAADAYRTRKKEVQEAATQILEVLRRGSLESPPPPENIAEAGRLGPSVPAAALQALSQRFDAVEGGFGGAPKFPQPLVLEFLLAHSRRTGEDQPAKMAVHTLRKMARGGMRDHLGGGFHRYSVDARWLVPHFEKMLYDNGLLASVYLYAYQTTGDPELREAACSTLDYVLADLTSPEGGFYSARDADSEGEEGLFYVWTPDQISEILGPAEASLFQRVYDVSASGNFEGRNILHQPHDLEALARSEGIEVAELQAMLARGREALRAARSERPEPLRDEKVLLGWNALVMRALAEAGVALERDDFLRAAEANARFLLDHLRRDGELFHTHKDGISRIPAFLEDYAALGNALLTLYQATLRIEYLTEADSLCERMVELFWADDDDVFFDAAEGGETLVVRPREVMDNATPSGTSLAVELLFRMDRVRGIGPRTEIARRALVREVGALVRFPEAFGRLLTALTLHLSPPVEVAVVLPETSTDPLGLLKAAHAGYDPSRIVVGGDLGALPFLPALEGKDAVNGQATAYLCRNFTCGPPIHDPESLREELLDSD